MNHLSYYYKRVKIERFKKPADFYFMMDTKDFSAASLNPLLEERLQLLKRERERVENQIYFDRVGQSVDFLNDILYQAISHHAPDFNGVEVHGNFDINRGRADLMATLSQDFIIDYFKKTGQPIPESGTVPFSFVLHLPYKNLGHGHQPSDARTVNFDQGIEKHHTPANFVVDLSMGSGPMGNHPLHLSLEEMSSIKLIMAQDSQFSPIYRGKIPLMTAPSALMHYLSFAGFTSGGNNVLEQAESIDDKAIAERVGSLVGKVLFPGSDLMFYREIDNHMHISGFAAVNNNGTVELYHIEFNQKVPMIAAGDIKLYKGDIYAADIISRHNAKPLQDVKVYTEHEAVKILDHNIKHQQRIRELARRE